MHVAGWQNGEALFRNRFYSQLTTTHVTYGWLARQNQQIHVPNEYRLPESLGPYELSHPTIVYIGNGELEAYLLTEKGETILQNILKSSDCIEFQHWCDEANKLLSLTWPNSETFRSILMFI